MAKKKITELIEEISEEFLRENRLELYFCEFVKEGKDWFLRVYIDKAEAGRDDYVSTDDCELVSRFLSEKLDEIDPCLLYTSNRRRTEKTSHRKLAERKVKIYPRQSFHKERRRGIIHRNDP